MDDYLPIVVGIIAAVLLFFAAINVLKKTVRFKSAPSKIDSRMDMREQQRRMDDIRARQKQMMRDQKQKIRDLKRR